MKMKWKIQETKLHAIPAGSFAVHTGDHLQFEIIFSAI